MFGFGPKNTISAQEAHNRMEQEGDKIIVLDVRTLSEYRQFRIKGAKLLPVNEIDSRASTELPDKDKPILVYCQSGARADSAVKLLKRMGYSDVVSFGGIISWPYETVIGQ